MISVSGFCDLSVSDQGTTKTSLRETCLKLVEYGYKTIAINQTINESVFDTKKKKRKGDKQENEKTVELVPLPISFDFEEEFKGKLQILHRLTVQFSESLHTHLLSKSENLAKYNLIAVLPKTSQALQYACGGAFDCDIITFNPEERNNIKFNRKLYNQAIERGIHFELPYAPAIKDSTSRKNIIHMAHMYHAYGKSKNIFVTSNASEAIHVRGPYDVINLGLIFGLSEEQSKTALTSVCRTLVIRGEGRRHGKAVMIVQQIKHVNLASDDESSNEETSMDDELLQPASKKLKQYI